MPVNRATLLRGVLRVAGIAGAMVVGGASAIAATDAPDRTAVEYVVAADGSGPFRSVQAAIDSLPAEGRRPVLLHIRPGVYKERIVLRPHPYPVIFQGDGPAATEKTVLTYDWSARTLGPDNKPVGTSNSASVTLEADDFTAENLTFENSAGPGSKVGQAVAVKVMGDRCVFRHCRFLGWQDTLYASTSSAAAPAPGNAPPAPAASSGGAPNGAMPGANRLCRQLYQDCYVAGSVDFIFGSARAVFDHCVLHSRGMGPLTAHARTDEAQPGGYIFHDCDLTAASDVPPGSVILGRPWRPYARVVYLNCRMGSQIDPKGWGNWNDPAREKTAFYAEAGCTGPGAERAQRVPWERTLTPAEIAAFAPRAFLAGSDNWDPLAQDTTAPGAKRN